MCLVSIMSIGKLHGELPITYLKGMTATKQNDIGVQPQFAHLSPTIGAIWWNMPTLYNFYKFAPEKDPLRNFVQQLFYVHIDESFDTTRSPKKIATYFTPIYIGFIIAVIGDYIQNYQSFDLYSAIEHMFLDKQLAQLFNKKQLELINKEIEHASKEIKDLEKQIEESNKLGKPQKTIRSLSNNIKTYRKSIQAKKRIIATVKDDPFFLLKKYKLESILKENVAEFSQSLTQALEAEIEGRYVPGTVIRVLLAFLWKRANSFDDLRLYLTSFANLRNIQTQTIDITC